jgi:hypothetical protein
MGSIPYAISLHKFVSSVGADAGYAALAGLALLVLLYFAQARETNTLREQASEAADRVMRLEERVAELVRAAARPQAAQSASDAQAAAAGARAGTAAAGVAGTLARRPRVHVGPPAGVAAPALAAATRLIPLPTDNGGGDWPDEPIKVHRAGEDAAAAPAAVAGAATVARPATTAGATTVSGGNGAGHGRVPPVGAPPRRRIEPGRAGAGAGRAGAVPRRPLVPPPAPRRRSRALKILFGLVGVLVLGAGVAAALIATSHNGPSRSSASVGRTSNAPGAPRPVAFNPHAVTVSVLNGTGTAGLAHRTALRLAGAGYRQGTIATATDQTRTTTQVAYLPGFRADALRVATALKLHSASVQAIDPGTRAVACPPPAACTADVVVTVGSDLASVY